MLSYVKYNKGYSIDSLLRKIYIKYVYTGNPEVDEVDMLYSQITNLIDNIKTESDKEEIENLINTMYYENRITIDEYNYLLSLLDNK